MNLCYYLKMAFIWELNHEDEIYKPNIFTTTIAY